MQRSNKGFLLVDSLLTVFIVSCICILCFSIYRLIERYDEGYVSYTERMNDYYVSVFNSYEYCESCEVDESD